MEHLSAAQLKARERIESLIKLAAPALDLVLSVGEFISRRAEPVDREYYPVSPPGSPKPPPPPAP